MIEAHILIDRELVFKGRKKAYGRRALGDGASFYSMRAFYVFLVVAAVDGLYAGAHLIGPHLVAISALAIGAAFYHYFDWLKRLEAAAADFELHVVLDDDGVTFKNEPKTFRSWNDYAFYREYGDYLEITDKAGEISYLPKRDEYAAVIVFTKSKIAAHEH
ncbi:MAG: hypothetical protein JSS81_26350 [Acidobacteria bacterium]|nr:hypothetical protein [Acidobacteriota bacterium]